MERCSSYAMRLQNTLPPELPQWRKRLPPATFKTLKSLMAKSERKPLPFNVIIPELILLCLGWQQTPMLGWGSKLGAGLLQPLMDIKEYLTWSFPLACVQGWSVCTVCVDEAEPSRRDCPGGLHHHPNSLSQDRSWCTSFASCLALTRTQNCTAQHQRKITSVL